MSRDQPVIPPEVLLAAFAHARETYPEECCGLFIGPAAGGVSAARRCHNRQNDLHAQDPTTFKRDARTAYNLGPDDLRFLDRSLRQKADPVTRIVYHSHNDVGAYFSAEDKRAALYEGDLLYPVDYLVVDVRINGVRGARLFRWQPDRRDFIEVGCYDADGLPSAGFGE